VEAHAPQDKKIDVGPNNLFVKILIIMVKANVLLSSIPAHEYKGKGGG
jgi:hypothetical protein